MDGNRGNAYCFTEELAIKAYPIHGETQEEAEDVRQPGFESKSTQHIHAGG